MKTIYQKQPEMHLEKTFHGLTPDERADILDGVRVWLEAMREHFTVLECNPERFPRLRFRPALPTLRRD